MGFSPWRPSLPPSLKPKQRLLLILTSMATEDTDWDTDTVSEDTTVDMVLATTASVRPRPSPRLLLILTFTATEDTDWDRDTDMVDTDSGLMDLDTDTVDSSTESKITLRPD